MDESDRHVVRVRACTDTNVIDCRVSQQCVRARERHGPSGVTAVRVHTCSVMNVIDRQVSQQCVCARDKRHRRPGLSVVHVRT